jgi:hypothetical protein
MYELNKFLLEFDFEKKEEKTGDFILGCDLFSQ